MSEESGNPDLVECVREIFAAASRRDWETIIRFHLPASVWDASRFEMGTFVGPESTRRLFEDWIGAYEDWQIELEDVVDLGGGIVFAIHRQIARLPGSTTSLKARDALVFQWKRGMITRVTAYPDIDDGRAAAERLAEEGGSAAPGLAELARRFCDCLERGDYDAALSFFGDDPVWDMSTMGMGIFEGRAPVRGLFEDWNGSYEEWEIELEDLRDLGNGVVYVVVMERGRPVGSTARVQLRYAAVIVFVEEMINNAKTFLDIDEARTAAEQLAGPRS